jgi:predicted nucleic acid-binding protein
MIVVDTNVAAYLLISGPDTADAIRARAKDREWVAPILLRYELMNVLVQSVKLKHLARDTAARMFRRALSVIRMDEQESDPLEIMNLVVRSKCSPYDIEFIWLAERLDVRLLTEDGAVLEAFPDIAISLQQFLGARS